MELPLLTESLRWIAYAASLILGAIVGGALLAGIFRVVTQIDDQSISLAGKLAAVAVLLYLAGQGFSTELADFTVRVWGGSDFYR